MAMKTNEEAKQEAIKLITLSEFIDKQEKDFPSSYFLTEMHELLINKYKAICQYNEFLKRKLTIEMFEGDNKIFIGGKYIDLQPSREWNYYSISGIKIFEDGNGKQNMSLGMTISDISGRGIHYKPIIEDKPPIF